MVLRLLVIPGLVLVSLPCVALSQSMTDASRTSAVQADTIRVVSILFDKNFDTYRWQGLANYARTIGRTSLQINEQFISSLIRTDQKLIRDEQLLSLSFKHRFTDNVRGVVRDSSFSLSDNKSVTIGNASYHMIYGGVEYQPIDHLTVEPLIGFRMDRQLEQYDNGPSYRFGFLSDPLQYGGYQTKLYGNIQYDKLSSRILETRNASVNIERFFFERTRNLLLVQYSRSQRDFYFPADTNVRKIYNLTNNIESRTENVYSLSDSLDYDFGNSWLVSLQGNIFSRSIERSTRYKVFAQGIRPSLNTTIEELKIDGGTTIRYSSGNALNAAVSFNYQERDEKHRIQPEDAASQAEIDNQTQLEEFKNNHWKRSSLSSTVSFKFSDQDSASLTASSSLLRYDTPSTANDDDRDELWHIINLSAFHQFNRYVMLNLSADINLMHLVYIKSTRSANNTWNRIFRLSPRLWYSPASNFTTVNTFEVLANYTVYDIEYQFSSTRSYVFRQFAFVDSSSLGLSRRLTLEWFNNLRFYERGELRWDAFTERPVNYFVDKTYIGKIRYETQRRLIFSVGIRYFSQLRYGYIGSVRNLESTLKSIGPIMDIAWNTENRTNLALGGWYENLSQTGVPERGFATLWLSLTVHI